MAEEKETQEKVQEQKASVEPEVPAKEIEIPNELLKTDNKELSLKEQLDNNEINFLNSKVQKIKTKQEASAIISDLLSWGVEKKKLLDIEKSRNKQLIDAHNKIAEKERQDRESQFNEGLHKEELLSDRVVYDAEKIQEKNIHITQRTHYLFILFLSITFLVTLLI
jgi:hypothetical protein